MSQHLILIGHGVLGVTMRKIISAIVTLFLIASVAIGSEAPDEYRQVVRSDPLIHSIIVALSAKHGCPWLHETHGNGGMRVMKEVEPFFYSKVSDTYKPTVGILEVELACSHGVSATVHTKFYDAKEHQQLVKYLDGIDFSYENFLPKLGRNEPSNSTPSTFILADPVVTRLLPVLTANQEGCAKTLDGKIKIAPETSYRPGLQGQKGLLFEYQDFELSYVCTRKSSGTVFRFKGGFYTESGLVTWKKLEVSGWVN